MSTIDVIIPRPDLRKPPLEALELLEATWIRCRMAGMQLAHNDSVIRRFGWIVTGLTLTTSLGVFVTLQQDSSTWARVVVATVTGAAGVLAGLQTKATKDAQDAAKAMTDVVKEFHELHVALLAAVSAYVSSGEPLNPELIQRARDHRDRHTVNMGPELPAYEPASKSVTATMRGLGLLVK